MGHLRIIDAILGGLFGVFLARLVLAYLTPDADADRRAVEREVMLRRIEREWIRAGLDEMGERDG